MDNSKNNKNKSVKKSKKPSKKMGQKYRLHQEVYEGNDKNVSKLLLQGFDLNEKDEFGDTPLHIAVGEGHTNLVEILLDRGADVNASSNRMIRSIHIAANFEHSNIFHIIIKHNANVNVKNFDGETPLHIAAQRGRLDFVESLLQRGADINSKEKKRGDTPLHVAIYFKNIDIAELLLKNNCHVNITNLLGEIPLHVANCKESIQLLLNYGADINIENKKGETIITIYFSYFKFNDVHKFLREYVQKLKLINYCISEKNNSCIQLLENAWTDKEAEKYRILREKELDFVKKCESEIAEMKRIKLCFYTSLYDFLHRNSNKLAMLTANDLLKDYYKSHKFINCFPNYGYILKINFEKGLIRQPLIVRAKIILKNITKIDWPDLCSEGIIEYLNNEELNLLIITLGKTYLHK